MNIDGVDYSDNEVCAAVERSLGFNWDDLSKPICLFDITMFRSLLELTRFSAHNPQQEAK